MKFDMMRARIDGRVVPRHTTGQLRTVRGELYLKDEFHPDLNRYSRTGTFRCEDGQQLKLLDVTLMHASPTMLTLSGFERGDRNCIPIDFAQTWVLKECIGPEPEGSIGPPFNL